MLYLVYIGYDPIDFSVTISRLYTIIILLIVIVFEVGLTCAIHSTISKKKNKDFWYSAEGDKKDEDLPYNKKNFIFKWFLCGTKNKIPVLMKVLAFIKNLVFLTFCGLCITHLIIFNHNTSVYARIFMFCTMICQGVVDVPLIIRDKFNKKNN